MNKYTKTTYTLTSDVLTDILSHTHSLVFKKMKTIDHQRKSRMGVGNVYTYRLMMDQYISGENGYFLSAWEGQYDIFATIRYVVDGKVIKRANLSIPYALLFNLEGEYIGAKSDPIFSRNNNRDFVEHGIKAMFNVNGYDLEKMWSLRVYKIH